MNNHTGIVADIGGTNARFAWIKRGETTLNNTIVFPAADYPHLEDAIRAYMLETAIEGVEKICLAVAGPAGEDIVDLPNNHWRFSCAALEAGLDIPLSVINDFTAQAFCLDCLDENELCWVGEPRPRGGDIRTVVGPGTGLGVAIRMPSGDIVPSEGGHVAFAPTNDHEMALLKVLMTRYDRVSVERLLSGQGLSNLYWANARIKDEERELSPPEIVAGAGVDDPLCLQTIDDFFNILASVTGDFALMSWSVDGVYLSGGILPRVWNLFDVEKFRTRFEAKGRFREFCASTPIALIQAEQPGLLGCAAALNANW